MSDIIRVLVNLEEAHRRDGSKRTADTLYAAKLEIQRLTAEIDSLQQVLDEIIVALGSRGIIVSGIVKEIERLTADKKYLVASRAEYIDENRRLTAENKSLRELVSDYIKSYEALAFPASDRRGAHAWVNRGICCSMCATPEQRMSTMIVCPDCGDKRCPRAEFHGNKCHGDSVGLDFDNTGQDNAG